MKEYDFDFIVLELGGSEYHLQGRERARMSVRIRDGFKCRSCGNRRTIREVKEHNSKIEGTHKGKIKLHDVHHLDGECGKNSRGYDSTKDISKLVTLCHKCHFNHHQFSLRRLWRLAEIEKKRLVQAVKEGNQNVIRKLTYKPSKRTLEMLELRKVGKTLEQIGSVYKITRERVRQILFPFGDIKPPKPLLTKKCPHCPRTFTTKNPTVKTCRTEECMQARKAATKERVRIYHREFARHYYWNVLKKRPDFKERVRQNNRLYQQRRKARVNNSVAS